jgi:predicted DNA-binding transcriptional regulator YafY
MAELTPPPETPRAPAAITEVLKLLQSLMAGRALTVAEAARRHRYQEAAVRRHLLAIQTVFREVVADKVGRGHVFRFVWPRQQASDATTVLALQIARTALVSLRGSALDGKLAELVQDHLARNADPRVQAHDLGRLFWSRTRLIHSPGVDPDTVDRIAACMLEQRQLTCEYQHFSGKLGKLRLEPWTLVPSEEGLFLYARCADGDRPEHIDTRRLYRVARLKQVRKTPEHFAYPPRDEYDPAEVFRHCFGIFLPEEDDEPAEIVLRFHPRWQAYLGLHPLHETQQPLEIADDGWCEVRLRVYVTLDLVRWLRGHGAEVRVLAPERLQTWLAAGA